MRRSIFLALTGLALVSSVALADDFSTADWISEGEKPIEEMSRNHMLADLDPLLVPGMNEAAIIDLIGEPQSRSGNEMIYDLGIAPYGIDFEYLAIVLDEEGNFLKSVFRRN